MTHSSPRAAPAAYPDAGSKAKTLFGRHPWLAAANPESLDRLAADATCIELDASQALALPASKVVLVVTGVLRVYVHGDDGRQVTLLHLSAPGIWGDLSTLGGGRLATEVAALSRSSVVLLAAERLLALLRAEPQLTPALLADVCARTRAIIDASAATLAPAAVRLAAHLLDLLDLFGEPTPTGTRLRLAISQDALAAGIGVVRRSVERVLRDLRSRGILSVCRGWIVVHDVDALRAAAGEARWRINHAWGSP